MKTKILFACLLLVATQVFAQRKEETFSIKSGATIPSLKSIEVMRQWGPWYLGLQLIGDFEVPIPDASPAQLLMFNLIGGVGLVNTENKFFRHFKNSGVGASGGLGSSNKGYDNSFPPFDISAFLNISYEIPIGKKISFYPHIRPNYTVLLLGKDQRGIYSQNRSQEGWYLTIGGGLYL
jgi:hypothetical protein